MVTLRLAVTHYDKATNTCKAVLQNGDIVDFDPYVGCAIRLSDDEYENGEGKDIVGCEFLLIEYTVTRRMITPHENGLILLTQG